MTALALQAVLFDVGGTLVVEAPPTTPTGELKVELFPGVLDGLLALSRHVHVGAVTNTAVMTECDVRGLLRPSGLDQLLEVVVTSVDVGVSKPDPAPIVAAMDLLGLVDPRRVLFVGNNDVDEVAAARAGTAFARVDGAESVALVIERVLRDMVVS